MTLTPSTQLRVVTFNARWLYGKEEQVKKFTREANITGITETWLTGQPTKDTLKLSEWVNTTETDANPRGFGSVAMVNRPPLIYKRIREYATRKYQYVTIAVQGGTISDV